MTDKIKQSSKLFKKYFHERWNIENQCIAIKLNTIRCDKTRYNNNGYCKQHKNWFNNKERITVDICKHTYKDIWYYASIKAKTEVYGLITANNKLHIKICDRCNIRYATELMSPK